MSNQEDTIPAALANSQPCFSVWAATLDEQDHASYIDWRPAIREQLGEAQDTRNIAAHNKVPLTMAGYVTAEDGTPAGQFRHAYT